jgi:hypothetical protein
MNQLENALANVCRMSRAFGLGSAIVELSVTKDPDVGCVLRVHAETIADVSPGFVFDVVMPISDHPEISVFVDAQLMLRGLTKTRCTEMAIKKDCVFMARTDIHFYHLIKTAG